MFDKLIRSGFNDAEFEPKTLYDIIFTAQPHRDENAEVIYSHIGDQFVSISLKALRKITYALSGKLKSYGFDKGDTLLLASFNCSNELGNALIFTAAVCNGIRVFVPIFPEPSEFENWKELTDFSGVIVPYSEILQLKGYDKEKAVISAIRSKCKEHRVQFLDPDIDFTISDLILKGSELPGWPEQSNRILPAVSPENEAVIFTTSGTSGRSKLVVYTHEGLANCCQAWQFAGLFSEKLFGNPGLSPLFTHTIGIRTFINSIWSGNPFCIVVTDWFLHKPEVVRYLLLKMKLGHLIAGPAFYNTIMELFRQFPELKTGIKQTLKTAISIGAPFDATTALNFRSATGVSLMNAFGTTETLMISLNKDEILTGPDAGSLGSLLPGVTVGLKQTEEVSVYELFIHSVFQSARTIGEAETAEFLGTGDLVTYNEENQSLYFRGRKSGDFLKDEYGVKIPLTALHFYYEKLYAVSTWIEWIPLVNMPGLSAIVFLPTTAKGESQKTIAAVLKSINNELKLTIEPFEYAHRHIERFSLLSDEVPLTRKGTVSKDQIHKKYDQLIKELRNPFVYSAYIETVETGDKSLFYKYSNPHMAELLEANKLDKEYIKATGDYLFYREGDDLHRVTDLVGGFGSNLLGHNHPKIKEAILQFLDSEHPALNNQGSQYHYPGLLARELNRIFSKYTGKYFKVQFGNSGTEAVEIALHHAYFEWRQKIEKLRDEQLQLYGSVACLNVAEVWDNNMRLVGEATPCLLVINNCFHGYSSGSRSLLNNKKQRYLFSGLLRPRPLHVSDSNKDWPGTILEYINENTMELQIYRSQNGSYVSEPVKLSTIIASVIEPIRGEGGINEINPALVVFLAGQDFPLISDEIQCGLGRTGSFPACKNASYYLLGKSLGGGIEKIAAVLIDDLRFRPSFTQYYNSTFANGELAAFTALTTLKIIEEENLPEVAGQKGMKFLSMLKEVAQRFPDVIELLSGKGLMIGIHFSPQLGNENNFFRILNDHEKLGYFIAGWMLNKHHIRVLPSLSKPNTLRVEPSFYFTESEMQVFCHALEELCILCSGRKVYSLCKFLMNEDPYQDKIHPVFTGLFPQHFEQPAPGALKVGFIGNFTLPHRELQVLEPDFLNASDTGLRILFNRLHILLEGKPIKIISKNLLGGKVHFTFYVLPFDTSQMEIVSRWGKKRFYIARIQEAADAMAESGALFVSLGAHTSIITGNGLNLAERGNCKIVTGNSLTVASCLHHLDQYLENSGIAHSEIRRIAIVGASGNIGSGLVNCLDDPKYAPFEIILAGNNEKRLQKLKDNLSVQNREVSCTNDLFELRRADIIICCANTNDPIVFPHHLSDSEKVFIIDISVPGSVSEEVKKMKNIIFCEDASSVYLKGDSGLHFSSHTPAGKIFCCAAEGIVCALYGLNLPMKGHIRKEAVQKLIPLAAAEGFFNKQDYGVSI